MKINNRRYKVKKPKLLHREIIKRAMFTILKTLFFLLLIAIASICVNHLFSYIVQSSYLTLKDIQFEGCQEVTPQELMRLARINMETNILTLDLKEIGCQLKCNRWVKEAKVSRIFPQALKITVDERVPAAVVSDKKLLLLDNDGVLFKEVENSDNIDMPVITGLSFSEQSSRLIKKVLNVLNTADKMGVLAKELISEVHIDNHNGLTLYTLQGAVPIRLGIGDYKRKLILLSRVQEDLCNRKVKPKAIDLISSGTAHIRLASSS